MSSIRSFPLLFASTTTPTALALPPVRVSIDALIVSPIRSIVSTISTFLPSTLEKLGFTAPATFFSPSLWGRTDAMGLFSDLATMSPRPFRRSRSPRQLQVPPSVRLLLLRGPCPPLLGRLGLGVEHLILSGSS